MKKHDLDEIDAIIKERPDLASWIKDLLLSVTEELRTERKCRNAYQEALTDNYKKLREENDYLRNALNNSFSKKPK